MAHDVVVYLVDGECEMVKHTFHTLQRLVSSKRY